MDHQIVLWTRADGLRCLALKHPPERHPRCRCGRVISGELRWELQIVRGNRLIKMQQFPTGQKALTAALTVWRIDFGLAPWPTKRYT